MNHKYKTNIFFVLLQMCTLHVNEDYMQPFTTCFVYIMLLLAEQMEIQFRSILPNYTIRMFHSLHPSPKHRLI